MATTIGLGLDGIILAPIEGGRLWDALTELRSAMRGGAMGRARFVTAMAGDGALVEPGDPRARLLVLGYRSH